MDRRIRRLLIANRGEIAVRIIHACRDLGIFSVAVYSDADTDALHVSMADQALSIGPGPASESYLSIDKILQAARDSGADAVHPGYGFLSENADFARAVESTGLIWIGPPSSAIDLLGDKIEAKKRVSAAGVPVVPGYYDIDQSLTRLSAEAEAIGVPLLIKAAAGGGGRGQRVVRDLANFEALLTEAKREALASFGDDRVLLERFLERPRHIEFQIFGDSHGNVVSLFERECSVQRRQQKIIEESPSPVMTPELRQKMGDAAVAAGKAAGYVGAGTVEFLLDNGNLDSPQFFFLEVNTRLQVEHPVTEFVTGLDLVKLQIDIAEGKSLASSFAQDVSGKAIHQEILMRGHAMELRIYAEDPATGFLPSIGKIEQWIASAGPGIRVDSGVLTGSEVSPFYDPMLAKLIVSGRDRAEVIARAQSALCEFHVLGVKTNIEYLLSILQHPEFQSGNLTIRFLDDHFAHWKPAEDVPLEVVLGAVAEALLAPSAGVSKAALTSATLEGDSFNPWAISSGWRNA